jgi:hypothetical protein
MGTETDETSGRALKLDGLKQSSSSYDAESVENGDARGYSFPVAF